MTPNDQLRAALAAAAARFREYEAHHKSKDEQSTADGDQPAGLESMRKAGRNRDMAEVCEAALALADAADSFRGLRVRLDLVANGRMVAGWKEVRLEAAPLPGEALKTPDGVVLVASRMHEIEADGRPVLRLAVERPQPPPGVQAAPASALDQLKAAGVRPGSIIMPGVR